MKRKMTALLLVIMFCICGVYCNDFDVRAEAMGEDIDFSYLLTEDTLIGTSQAQTWGIYLAEGNSFINKISSSKIGAGGNTIASTKCQVSVTSIVERLDDGLWVRVTSWTSTTASGYSALISKSLSVGTGYYYRVRSTHYASTDRSSSCTSSLWMGN